MAFGFELLHQILEQLVQLFRRHRRQLLQHLLHLVVGEKLPAFERLLNGLFQVFEGLLIPLRELHVRIIETALQKKIGQRLHQILAHRSRNRPRYIWKT